MFSQPLLYAIIKHNCFSSWSMDEMWSLILKLQQFEVLSEQRKMLTTNHGYVVSTFCIRNIHTRAQRDMVLTVVLPTNQRRDEEGLTLNYVGCQVTVQKRKPSQFGSASQKWNLDQESGFIYAFHAHHLDVGKS